MKNLALLACLAVVPLANAQYAINATTPDGIWSNVNNATGAPDDAAASCWVSAGHFSETITLTFNANLPSSFIVTGVYVTTTAHQTDTQQFGGAFMSYGGGPWEEIALNVGGPDNDGTTQTFGTQGWAGVYWTADMLNNAEFEFRIDAWAFAQGHLDAALLTVNGCAPDFNDDGNLDQDDVACLINSLAGDTYCSTQDPDFNRDGNADQDDLAALINVIAGGDCP